MKRIAIALLLGAAAGACTTAPEQQPRRSPAGQQSLSRLLAGKTAGKPISCMQHYLSADMTPIDGRTVVFHSPGTAYLVQLSPGCDELARGGYALLTTERGGMGLCTGDIARVLDTTTRFTVGSCGVDRIVPYSSRRY